MPDISDYGALMMSEVSRRAWAVEQAVAAGAVPRAMDVAGDESAFRVIDPEKFVLGLADAFLNYLDVPLRAVDARLVAAARMWDGTGDAGPLIGALADALERLGRGG